MEWIELDPDNFRYCHSLMTYFGYCQTNLVAFYNFESSVNQIDLVYHIHSPFVIKPLGIGKLNGKMGLIDKYAEFMDYSLFFLVNCSNRKGYDSNYLLSIIYQIALGIRDIHQMGIIHMNIQPKSIILKNRGDSVRVMIIGFEQSVDTNSYESENVFCYGTEQYNPPEMDHRTPLTMAADIYAFGLCILLLLMPKISSFPTSHDFEVFMKMEQSFFPELDPLKEILTRIFVEAPDERITINEIVEFEFFKNNVTCIFDDFDGFLR